MVIWVQAGDKYYLVMDNKALFSAWKENYNEERVSLDSPGYWTWAETQYEDITKKRVYSTHNTSTNFTATLARDIEQEITEKLEREARDTAKRAHEAELRLNLWNGRNN